MTTTVTEYINKNDFNKFHEILCATGGRYMCNPIHCENNVLVNYVAGDYQTQIQRFKLATTPIVEVKVKNPWWLGVFKRIGLRR